MTEYYRFWEAAIYVAGVLLWLPFWQYLVGFHWLKTHRLLLLPFLGCLYVLAANVVLVLIQITPCYDIELKLYPYVEQNAKTVAGLALAISILVVIKFDKETKFLQNEKSRKFLWLTLWAFIVSVAGCLPLYWMPACDGWLTMLRHLKTIPFTYSLFILCAAILFLIYEIKDFIRLHVEKPGA